MRQRNKGAIVSQASIEAMVRQRVDEILAQEGAQLFEPEFQPKPIQAEAMRRLTVFERQKWALYFARWGCRQCKAKRKGHTGQGYCHTCYGMVRFRLLEIQKRWQMEHAGARERRTPWMPAGEPRKASSANCRSLMTETCRNSTVSRTTKHQGSLACFR